MQLNTFVCDHCDNLLRDCPIPVLVKITVGQPADVKGKVELTNFELPKLVWDIVRKSITRLDLCLDCFRKLPEDTWKVIPLETE